MFIKYALLTAALLTACNQQQSTSQNPEKTSQPAAGNSQPQPNGSQISQSDIEKDAKTECDAIRNLLGKTGEAYKKALTARSKVNDSFIQKYKDNQAAMSKRQNLVESCMDSFRDQLREHNEKPEIKKIQAEYNQQLGSQVGPRPGSSNGQKRSGPAMIDPKLNKHQGKGGPHIAPQVAKIDCSGDTKCVSVSGKIEYDGSVEGSIRIDVLQRQSGKAPTVMHSIHLEELGDFEFQVPAGAGNLLLTGFIDRESNGPTADDPIKLMQLQIEDSPITDVRLTIKQGGKGGMKGGPNKPSPK